ncbi:hypothetical protein CR513_12807, partial [Mucuna pruriens]
MLISPCSTFITILVFSLQTIAHLTNRLPFPNLNMSNPIKNLFHTPPSYAKILPKASTNNLVLITLILSISLNPKPLNGSYALLFPHS